MHTHTQMLQGENSIILALCVIPLSPFITCNYQKPKIPTHTDCYCSACKVIPINQRGKKRKRAIQELSLFIQRVSHGSLRLQADSLGFSGFFTTSRDLGCSEALICQSKQILNKQRNLAFEIQRESC